MAEEVKEIGSPPPGQTLPPAEPSFPSALLSDPHPPNLSITRIDFARYGLPEYKDSYATIIDGVLTEEECHQLVHAAEGTANSTWDRALLNVGNGQQVLETSVRHCGRIIWDSFVLADRLWARIAAAVPEVHEIRHQSQVYGLGRARRGEVWGFTRLNERMRFLKYTGGEYFKGHCDGQYTTPDGNETSFYTLQLYLTDVKSPNGTSLKGGATGFMSIDESRRVDVEPKFGRVLIFQHGRLYHSGDDVLDGVKVAMRTDLMYELKGLDPRETEEDTGWSRYFRRGRARDGYSP